MGRPLSDDLRTALVKCYEEARGQGRKYQVVKKFEKIVAKSTVLRILSNYDKRGHAKPLPTKGRPPKLATPEALSELADRLDHTDDTKKLMRTVRPNLRRISQMGVYSVM